MNSYRVSQSQIIKLVYGRQITGPAVLKIKSSQIQRAFFGVHTKPTDVSVTIPERMIILHYENPISVPQQIISVVDEKSADRETVDLIWFPTGGAALPRLSS